MISSFQIFSQITAFSTGIFELIQSYLTNPTIVPSVNGQPDYSSVILIDTYNYVEHNVADISQLMVINSRGSKEYLTDNIAPRPRSWSIEGYLSSAVYEISILSPFLQPTMLKQMADLKNAQRSREPVFFIPVYGIGGSVQAAITSLDIRYEAKTKNKIPIFIEISEISILSTTIAGQAIPQGAANPAAVPTQFGQQPSEIVAAGGIIGFGR